MSLTDIQAFKRAWPIGLQANVTDERRAIATEKSPTLLVIEKAYGDGSAVQWIMMQLAEFNEYCGKKEKLDDWQIENLAKGILSQYSQLKASEFLLFLSQYRNGKYGPLYGSVDPIEFMAVLKDKFLPRRARVAAGIEDEKARAERESWGKRPGILKPDEIRALRERLTKINNKLTNL